MALLKYLLLRVLVFAAVAALLMLTGLPGWWVLLVAVLVSGLISIFALRRTRDDVSTSLSDRLSTIKRRIDESTRAEDDWDNARRHHNDPPAG